MKKEKKRGGKMEFLLDLLSQKANPVTKKEAVKAYLKKFSDVPEKTAKNTVAWVCSVGLKKAGLKPTWIKEKKTGEKNPMKKENRFDLIVSLAKAGKTEAQITESVTKQFGKPSARTAYIIGREWRRVNKVGKHFKPTAGKNGVAPSKKKLNVPKRKSLVCQHLENMSRELLEQNQEIVREYVRRRQGIYALYRRGKIYYVGLASNLRSRLANHLNDRHQDSWDRFSFYLTIGDSHLRELESLILRIVKPPGNKQKGKFAKSEDLRRRFKRDWYVEMRLKLGNLLGNLRK